MQYIVNKKSAIFQDSNRDIWLLGEIKKHQLDLRSKDIYEPRKLRFKFVSKTESISHYYQMPHCLVILTDEKRIYVSNYQVSGTKDIDSFFGEDSSYPVDYGIWRYIQKGASNYQPDNLMEFALLADCVENLIVSSYLILFTRVVKEDNLSGFYLFDPMNKHTLNFRIRPVIGNFVYYELFFPFDMESSQFLSKGDGSGALYIQSHGYHHFICPDNELRHYYFYGDEQKIDPNKFYIWNRPFHFDPKKDSLGVKNRNTRIYYLDGFMKVLRKTDNTLKHDSDPEHSSMNLIGEWNGKNSFVDVVGQRVFLNKGLCRVDINIDPEADILTSPGAYFTEHFCIHETEHKPLFESIGNLLCFNTFGLNKSLVKVSSKIIVYYVDNTLFMISPKNIQSNMLDLMEQIETTNLSFKLYMFKRMPAVIDRLDFEGNLLFIQSQGLIYYLTLINCNDDCECFKKPNLELIEFDSSDHETLLDLVDEPLIQRSNFNKSPITVDIRENINCLDRLFQLVELLNGSKYDIEWFDDNMNKLKATGDGTRKNFFQLAMKEFKTRYLIESNYLTKFNFPNLLQLNELELKLIARSLSTYFINLRSQPLPFRLPLEFIQLFLDRKYQTEELEYFLMREDPELFKNLSQIKHDPKFTELSGYESYEDCLLNSLHLEELEESNKEILQTIRKNFKLTIKNQDKMNGPTLDYFLSGPYTIDRSKLIQMIKFQPANTEAESAFQDNFMIMLSEATDKEINNFLVNVTGIATYNNIKIEYSSSLSSCLNFRTCFNQLIVERGSMQNLELMKNLLFTINTDMNDF